jgi:hypothetical protein
MKGALVGVTNRLGQVTEAALMNTEDSGSIITYTEAVRQYGKELIESVLCHDRHHHDDHGRPYWLESELEEVLELVEIERRGGREARW